jgi:hypothetical protein
MGIRRISLGHISFTMLVKEKGEVASSNAIVASANLSNANVPRSGRRFWYETKGWSEDQTPRKHDHQQVGLESFGSGGW